MHGPTRIFWANLTPFSLKERASREKHDRRERHQAAGRARSEKAWEQQRAAARAQQEAEE